MLDLGVVPTFGDIILQCWVWGCKTSARAGGFGGGGVGACDGAADADGRLVLFTGVSGSPKSWSF